MDRERCKNCDENGEDWGRWKEQVLYRLADLKEGQNESFKMISALMIDVSMLKTKAAIVGAVFGGLMGFLPYLLNKLN